MKRIIFTLCILFSLFIHLKIRAENIDRNSFNKKVDYINCSLTDAYISSLVEEKENYDKIKPDLSKNSLDNPVSFESLSKLLKENNFTKTEKSLSSIIDKRKLKYWEGIDNNDLISILFNNDDLTDKYKDALSDKTDQLKKELFDKFQVEVQRTELKKSQPTDTCDLENRVSLLENSLKNDTNNSFWQFSFNIWTFFFSAIFSVIVGAIIFFIMRDYNLDLEERINRRVKIRDFELTKESLTRTIYDLESSVKKSSNSVYNLENKFSCRDNVSNLTLTPKLIEEKPKELYQQEFFMSTPNKDGSFNQSSFSLIFRPTASIYRFVIQSPDNNRASFYFADDEKAVSTAVNYPDTYIDPVCIPENAINYNAKRIITIKPGIAEKDSDKWTVIKKAIIKYE